jgi:hypothetical protein
MHTKKIAHHLSKISPAIMITALGTLAVLLALVVILIQQSKLDLSKRAADVVHTIAE